MKASVQLTSYYLTTAILWVHSKAGTVDLPPVKLLSGTVDYLTTAFRDRKLPDFFDDKANMIAGIETQHFQTLYSLLKDVNDNLSQKLKEMSALPMTSHERLLDLMRVKCQEN